MTPEDRAEVIYRACGPRLRQDIANAIHAAVEEERQRALGEVGLPVMEICGPLEDLEKLQAAALESAKQRSAVMAVPQREREALENIRQTVFEVLTRLAVNEENLLLFESFNHVYEKASEGLGHTIDHWHTKTPDIKECLKAAAERIIHQTGYSQPDLVGVANALAAMEGVSYDQAVAHVAASYVSRDDDNPWVYDPDSVSALPRWRHKVSGGYRRQIHRPGQSDEPDPPDSIEKSKR